MVKSFWKLTRKPIKSIRIKSYSDISIMYPLTIENLTIFFKTSKRLLKARFNSNPSKVHNYYLIKVSQENIFTLTFMISFFNSCLIVINNLKWNSIWIKFFVNNLINWSIHILNFTSPLLIMNAIKISKKLCNCLHN
jgi:hypothetical protein